MRQTTAVGFVAGVGIAMTSLTSAQVSPPNRAGVAMGHLHFHVRDVEANQKFWVALGGTPARALGMAHVVKFPGLLIVLSPGESSGTTAMYAGFVLGTPDRPSQRTLTEASGPWTITCKP